MKILLILLFSIISLLIFGQQELLTNGNFTSNNSAWITSGTFSYNTNFSNYNFDVGYAYSSDLPNESGTIEQQFTIPVNTTSATLSFYTNIISDEQTSSQVYDFCTVNLFTVGGNGPNHQFVMLSNLDENNGYQNMTFSIPSNFYGSNVRLVFIFGNDGATPTRFRFDNVSLLANTSGGGFSNADFYISNEGCNVGNVNAGNTVDVSCRQAYIGTSISTTEDVYLGYYLSTDQSLSANDYFFPITDEYSDIGNSDDYDNEYATLTVPSWTSSGQYYLIFKTDYNNQFTETNENNNTAVVPVYVSGIPAPVPTINITSPNQFQCVPTTSSVLIQAQITGAITEKQIDYSIDGGQSWNFIWGQSGINTNLSYNWLIPSTISEPTYVKFRVSVSYPGGNVIATINEPCLIIPPKTPFELNPNPNGVSHLFWIFEVDQYNWNFQERYKLTQGAGSGQHIAFDYYSLDYVKYSSLSFLWSNVQSTICYIPIYAPFDFTLLSSKDLYPDDCDYIENNTIDPSGNTVTIRSTQDSNFAFSIAHLNYVNSSLQSGSFYPKGTYLGLIGSTGLSNAPHAHCTLYKNITEDYTYTASGIPVTANFVTVLQSGFPLISSQDYVILKEMYSAEFILDAGSSISGGQIGIEEFESNRIVINPNPSQNGIFSIDSDEKLTILEVKSSNGQTIDFKTFDNMIHILNPSSGVYFLKVSGSGKIFIERIIVY